MGYYTLLFGKRDEVRYELPEENCTAQTRLIPDFGKLSFAGMPPQPVRYEPGQSTNILWACSTR